MARNEALERVRETLGQLDMSDLAGRHVGVNRCQRAQCLTRISIRVPTVMLPVRGKKRIYHGQERYEAGPGDILLLPPGIEIDIDNLPEPSADRFESAQLVFDAETLDLFGKLHGAQSGEWQLTPRWKARGTDALLRAISDWVSYSCAFAPDLAQTRHRMAELLLILARQGVVGNLLLPTQARLGARIKHLLALDLGRTWRAAELTEKLGMSESTLRRRLRSEGRSFRDLLEEVRLEHGIDLVMGTDMPISQVAFRCGYTSQSRFAERFRKRFSLSPTDLRATRQADGADIIPMARRRAG